ncbi:cullin family protein [Ancylostoma caninum]|uniref:Cullin family protein n=1 Tax=Ancylostoma caninum TaxID=29170 RepID=A0A368H7H0_ANCCA|nr:cullin family protein [Ancylostoma caninum]
MQSTNNGDTGVEVKSNSSSPGTVTPKKSTFVLQKGAQKRSLSVFSPIQTVAIQKRSKMSDVSDEMLSDEDSAEMYQQEFGEGEHEFMFERLIEGPNEEQFAADKERDDALENMVESRAIRQISRGLPTVKKLTIKNFRKKNNDVADLMTTGWLTLEASINAIQTKQHVTTSLEQLYKVVESLCENKMARSTYDKLLENVRKWIRSFREDLSEKSSAGGVEFMKALESLWSDYCQQMASFFLMFCFFPSKKVSFQILIRNVFLYLDRTFILENIDESPIWESSLVIFREEIVLYGCVLKKLVDGILGCIAGERAGDQVDRSLLRALLRMLRTLDLYKQSFEEEFLANTSVHYTQESMSLVRTLETVEFLLYIERRLKEENERVDFYLDESTRAPLLTRAEKSMISDHMQEVVDNGLASLLNDNRVQDVSRLYSLLSRKVGKAMIMDPQRDQSMVEDLMAFKDKLDVFVDTCFGSEDERMKFAQAEKDAFDYFINTRGNKPAELIAKYMDARLRSANKEASDEQLDQLMNKVITLFRFIQGKDVFEVFYKKDLAKRLLLGRSASVDAEKIMLSKLRQECGAGFTQKLEGMFRDMELSKDLGVAFRNVTLPKQLNACLQLYEKFYDSRHTGRKLQWQPRLGQCVLKANFRPGCDKELKVSLFQAIVLLLFNNQPSWTAADIMMATKLEQKEFVRTMVSLSCAKVRVLVKTPMNKEIKDDDVFTVNNDMKEMRFRIRISEVQMKETEEEYKAVEEEVNQDRQYQIDAAIVRVMKTRKKLNHQLLISELFAQLRFFNFLLCLSERTLRNFGVGAQMCSVLANPAVRRYLLWISYDGSRFPEMATGGTGFGVVDMMYQTISDSLFGARPNIKLQHEALKLSPSILIVSHRTDAGVHALRNALICQVPLEYGNLDSTPEDKTSWITKWNATIETFAPGAMKVLDLHNVSPGFCVRRHVAYRYFGKYTYRLAVVRDWDLWESLQKKPTTACFSEKDYAWRIPPGFSPEKASDACELFIGRHVMGSFFKHTAREKRREPNPPSAVRNVLLCQLSKGGPYSMENDIYDYYNVTIVARSFVREQIRRMMSCLVLRGYDRLPVETIRWLLRNPISVNFYDLRIPIAPPQGLFLTEVVYPPEMFTNPIPYYRHAWDYPTENDVLFDEDTSSS